MVELNTERLRVVLIDRDNFELFVHDKPQMERNLGTKVTGVEIHPVVLNVMKMYLKRAMDDNDNYQWYVPWQMIHREDNKVIGSAGFKGRPNSAGEVEIGYGIDDEYEGRGFMTEAIRAISEWAKKQPKIKAVIAETDNDNIGSQRVLEKNGFNKYVENEKVMWWRL